MAIIDPEKLRRIREIIERTHNALAIRVGDSAEFSYKFGQLLAQDGDIAQDDLATIEKKLAKAPPLSRQERNAMAIAKQRAGDFCRGLGNKVNLNTQQVLIEADRELRIQYQTEIRDAVSRNIAARETVSRLRSDLGHATEDWSRDFRRIAVTEKHRAMSEGQVDEYREEYGPDARVAVRPTPDACQHCKRLYIGPDGQPRVFLLSDLEANGSNYGRKAADWLPVVPPMHPNCQCQLVRVPEGWGFDGQGRIVPGGELGVLSKHLRAEMRAEYALEKAFALEDRFMFQGFPIAIENKRGTFRYWDDGNGGKGKTLMLYAYGYIEGSMGADGDSIDVFIGNNPNAGSVYIIHQQNPGNGIYDEDKVMLGFSNAQDAELAYRAHYDRPDFYVACSEMSIEHLRRLIDSQQTELSKSHTQAEPERQKLVIRLDKSRTSPTQFNGGTIAPESVTDSFPAARGAPSGHGNGLNLYFNVPANKGTPTIVESTSARTFIDGEDEQKLNEERKVNTKDLHVYSVEDEAHLRATPIGAESLAGMGLDVTDPEERERMAAENREWIDRNAAENLLPKNTVEIEDTGDETLH